MKTYTLDEIKVIMIQRPGEVFVAIGGDRMKYCSTGILWLRSENGKWERDDIGLLNCSYHIESEREAEEKAKKYALPESVVKVIGGHGWLKDVFTAYHAEVVKMLEGK